MDFFCILRKSFLRLVTDFLGRYEDLRISVAVDSGYTTR